MPVALARVDRLAGLGDSDRQRLAWADLAEAEWNENAADLKHALFPQTYTLPYVLGIQKGEISTSMNRGGDPRGYPLIRGELLGWGMQILQVRAALLGPDDPSVARAANNLGAFNYSRAAYADAEKYFRQAAEANRKTAGEGHPDYATNLDNLGRLAHMTGDYVRALELFQQAHDIRKKALGESHPDYALSLNNLGGLYQAMGNFVQAEHHLSRAAELRRAAFGQVSPIYAQSLNNLAGLYEAQTNYAEADRLLRQAAKVLEDEEGVHRGVYAVVLNNLGAVSRDLGKDDEARAFYLHSLDLIRDLFGDDHPYAALRLQNLGSLYQTQGDFAAAEQAYAEALKIRAKLGENHPDYSVSLNSLAGLYDAKGDHEQAVSLFRKGLQAARDNLELASTGQSESQQMAMAAWLRYQLDGYLSAVSRAQLAGETGYGEALLWKGAVLTRQKMLRSLRGDPDLASLFDELQRLTNELARSRWGLTEKNSNAYTQYLVDQKNQIESDLARKAAGFGRRLETARRTVTDVQTALPDDTALIDFVEYTHYTPPSSGKGPRSRERRLLAFVVCRARPVVRLDLGPSQPIAEAVDGWRKNFGLVDTVQAFGNQLRRLIWDPVEPHISGVKTVLVSPDGPLSRFPLTALPGKAPDKYLIEEYAIAVLPVPQLLPELSAVRGTGQPRLLVLADVQYGGPVGGGELVAMARSAPRGMRAGERMIWGELPGTRLELVSIKDSFQRAFRQAPPVTELRECGATEDAVRRRAPGHRYLHFATHGFFAPPSVRSSLDWSTGQPPPTMLGPELEKEPVGYDPGLLAGLVLAGANQPTTLDRDDGILTALEVEELDLRGVELAVLSACETGLGPTAGGEGLLGLQRAFQIAGTGSVVASLWRVDDQVTAVLMSDYYDNLWRKKMPKLEALRAAQRTILEKGINRAGLSFRNDLPADANRRLPPYYWAAFVLSGDWR